MHWTGRQTVLSLLALVAITPADGAFAQTAAAWPSKAIRIIVPSSPGGGTDITARALGPRVSDALGQPVVIDNRPGAGQLLGTELVARAPPDGYTQLMAASAIVLNQVLATKPPYDVLRDFVPITAGAFVPHVLTVHPSLPARSVKELIALARANPGALNYSSAGPGTSLHMAMELFLSMARIQAVHVPYKGAGPATTDLLAGHVQMATTGALTVAPHLRAGKLRALGVTGAKRAAALPDVPTIAEAGVPGYEAIFWYALFAPAGTPRVVVDRMQSEVAKALQPPDVRERLAADGAEPGGMQSDAFAAFIKSELDKWSRVVRQAKLSLN
jgi:tripartite-type tricarboxylate transporter receptor subunit TctC